MPSQNRSVYTASASRVGISAPVAHASTACRCPVCAGLQCLDRTRFFAGQLLSEADLNNEQSYWLAKSRLHNRYLNGWGVVCGMQVTCGECDGWVRVHSGYAIDPCGNDVIVCADQNFNVLQAIQQCCAPAAQQTQNCSPLRYNPSPTCKDAKQEWCITIQYQEQASRLVTPLTSAASQCSCSCGCGSSNGTGCGCSSSKSKTSSANLTTSGSCKSKTTQSTTATVPAGACEATRIVEGFQLGVVPSSEVEAAIEAGNPNSLKSQLQLCAMGLGLLLEQAPSFTDVTSPQSAYQSTCNYLAQVTQDLTEAANITLCVILDDLSKIKVASGQDLGVYTGIIAEIKKLLAAAYLNCLCYALLPPCPPQPCDNRIVLACVTVQNGKVINICHFPGRKQLITLQTLGYWLGPLGLDNLRANLGNLFAKFCCGEDSDANRNPTFGTNVYYNEDLKSAGVSSAADMNRIAAHYVAQSLGASMVNAISPGARAVDLRPYVNMQTETVQANLRQQGFKTFTLQNVEDDPAWTADAVSNSVDFAPAAVSSGQALTIYTKGNVAVGFDVVDPTTAKLNDLQNQINALQSQLAGSTPAASSQKSKGAPPTPASS